MQVADEKAEVKKPRKIAILGTASVSLDNAPYDNLEWKIWNMSNNFWQNKRFDLWFEVHDYDTLKAAGMPPQYEKFLKDCGARMVAGRPSEANWPDAIILPLEQIILKFGDYFTCSFAYMIAYAMYLHAVDIAAGGPGVGTIGLWGVDMSVGAEYSHQKPCAEYWIGMARGMGIEVYIAPESPICRTNALYAFDNPKLAREFTDRIHDIARDLKATRDKRAIAHAAVVQLDIEIVEMQACEKLLKEICHRWAL